MIYCIDNFLSNDLLKETQDHLNNNEYSEVKTPGKSFWTQDAPEEFVKKILRELSVKEGKDLECILAFFKVSNEEVDAEWRIHSDLKIAGQKPDRAIVLYLSPKEMEELHGTAFWEHKVYGKSLPDNTTDEEYDRMIRSESENLDSWRLSSVSGYEENRLISYPANYFHSKYPNKSWKNGRQVFVMFYKQIDYSQRLKFRPLNQLDYDTICEWWTWWRWPIIEKDCLPQNGTGGFMVEKNGVPIVCGFVYTTNSKGVLLEWIVSNPKYKESDRKEAIELLINQVEVFCKSLGKKFIFSIGRSKHLMKTHEKLGWQVDKKPSYEITKKI